MLDPIAFDPKLDYTPLFNALLPISFCLLLAGLWPALNRAASAREFIAPLVSAIVAIACVAHFDQFGELAQKYITTALIEKLDVHPDEVHRKFVDTVLLQRNGKPSESKSAWAPILNPSLTLMEAVIAAVLFLAALIATAVLYLSSFFQSLLLHAAYALVPLFVGLTMLNATRSIGVHFFLAVAAVLLTPLGWAIAALGTNALINYATNQSVFVSSVPEGGWAYAFRNLAGGLILSVWVVATSIACPIIIYKALTSGVFTYRR